MSIVNQKQRYLNRLLALVIGMISGIISMVIDSLLRISSKIVKNGLAPWYSEGALSAIILPMTFGAIVIIVYTLGSSKITRTPTENLPSITVFIDRAVFGAVGAVIWWVVPIALFGITWYWLFLTSIFTSVAIGMIAEVIFGTFSDIPYFIIQSGPFIGGVIGGAIFGWGLGVFVVGLVKELGENKPWANKLHTNIGAMVGAFVGAIYGTFFAWNYIINGFMNFPD